MLNVLRKIALISWMAVEILFLHSIKIDNFSLEWWLCRKSESCVDSPELERRGGGSSSCVPSGGCRSGFLKLLLQVRRSRVQQRRRNRRFISWFLRTEFLHAAAHSQKGSSESNIPAGFILHSTTIATNNSYHTALHYESSVSRNCHKLSPE
jgi:hypothetical protein